MATAPPAAEGQERRVIVGTLNLLGDDQNPFQFHPSSKDQTAAGLTPKVNVSQDRLNFPAPHDSFLGGWQAFRDAKAHVEDVFDAFTLGGNLPPPARPSVPRVLFSEN